MFHSLQKKEVSDDYLHDLKELLICFIKCHRMRYVLSCFYENENVFTSIATMIDYLPSEIVDIIIEYSRSNENARECARLYALRFPNRRHPSRQTISNLIARARDGRLRRQRQKKDRTEETVLNIAILGMVAFNPHISQRRISLELHTSLFTVNRVLRANHFHLYYIERHQALIDDQKGVRVQFCRWTLQSLKEDNMFFDRMFFNDESSFHNNGDFNRHNCHYYTDVNPFWLRRVDNQHQ